jgi:hypothetical protein
MPTTIDDREFWISVEKIAKSVDKWPDWKKEGWAALDKREPADSVPASFENRLVSPKRTKSPKTSFE